MDTHMPQDRLDSWKAIAEFLKRDVRTVSRWESQRGLPVHRVPGGRRNAVFAYKSELEAWLGGHIEDDVTSNRVVANRSKLRVSLGLLGLVLAVFSIMAMLLLRELGGNGPLKEITFIDNRLVALDHRRNVLWDFEFSEAAYAMDSDSREWRIRIVDLDKDGDKEILAAAIFLREGRGQSPIERLYCFSSDGRLLWEYTPNLNMSLGGKVFQGPWHFRDLIVVDSRHSSTVWFTATHHSWWPSFVASVNPSGNVVIRFINSGWLMSLNHLTSTEGSFVLAGGVSNEYDAGILGIVSEDTQLVSAPSENSVRYGCEDCTKSGPHSYLVFPRSELNISQGATHNFVRSLRVLDSEIQVRAVEIPSAENGRAGASSLYTLSYGFDPESVFYNDEYWRLHRQLEMDGRVKHRLSGCTDWMRPKTIRVWKPKSGWMTVEVPRIEGGGK